MLILTVSAENTSFQQTFSLQDGTRTRWFQERRTIKASSTAYEIVTLNTCRVKDPEHGLETANQLNFLGCNVTSSYINYLNSTLTAPIKRLQLFSSKLDGGIESIYHFQQLQYLNIVNSSLSENFIWRGIKQLPRLEYIKIESSNLGRFFEESCVLCLPATLRTVILKNSLVNVTSTDFAGLAYLRFLDISHNNISMIQDLWRRSDGLLNDLVSLEVLDLSYNRFTQLNSTFFKGVSNLRELSLARNELVKLPSDTFKNLRKMIVLDLSYNRLTQFHKELLANTKRLKELNLTGNPIQGLLKHDFWDYKKLTVLFNWKERSLLYRVSDVFLDFYENEIRDM